MLNCSIFSPSSRTSRAANSMPALLEIGLDGPVLALDEALDLVLAFDDHPQRRTLDPSCRQPPVDLLPQQGRQVEAHEVVERPACLLGVDERVRDLREGWATASAIARLVISWKTTRCTGFESERIRIAEQLDDVPRDRLALTVGVGREVERFRLLHRPAQGLDVLLVALDGLVVHQEALLRLHRTVLRNEIAHVPVRGEDFVLGPQVLLDRPRLGGGFDD